MVERTGFGGEHYDDEDHEEAVVDRVAWYRLADPDYDPDEPDDEILDDVHDEIDLVGHQLDHAADDAARLDAAAQFGWRHSARIRLQGRFVPPDIRLYRWPTFVPVADLQNQDDG